MWCMGVGKVLKRTFQGHVISGRYIRVWKGFYVSSFSWKRREWMERKLRRKRKEGRSSIMIDDYKGWLGFGGKGNGFQNKGWERKWGKTLSNEHLVFKSRINLDFQYLQVRFKANGMCTPLSSFECTTKKWDHSQQPHSGWHGWRHSSTMVPLSQLIQPFRATIRVPPSVPTKTKKTLNPKP